jgi:dipeptidase
MHAGGLAAASQTTASWVADLTATGNSHWCTATAAPCTGLFKPVDVDQPLDLGPEPADRYDPHNLWWRHELLHRRCLTDPEQLLALFTRERDETERRWLAERPESGAAFDEADRLLERWSDAVWQASATDTRPSWVRRYWRARNRRAGLPDQPDASSESNVS